MASNHQFSEAPAITRRSNLSFKRSSSMLPSVSSRDSQASSTDLTSEMPTRRPGSRGPSRAQSTVTGEDDRLDSLPFIWMGVWSEKYIQKSLDVEMKNFN